MTFRWRVKQKDLDKNWVQVSRGGVPAWVPREMLPTFQLAILSKIAENKETQEGKQTDAGAARRRRKRAKQKEKHRLTLPLHPFVRRVQERRNNVPSGNYLVEREHWPIGGTPGSAYHGVIARIELTKRRLLAKQRVAII